MARTCPLVLRHLSLSHRAAKLGIPAFMKGPEVVVALRGIVITTALNTLSTEDTVRTLLDINNMCLFTQTSQLNASASN